MLLLMLSRAYDTLFHVGGGGGAKKKIKIPNNAPTMVGRWRKFSKLVPLNWLFQPLFKAVCAWKMKPLGKEHKIWNY